MQKLFSGALLFTMAMFAALGCRTNGNGGSEVTTQSSDPAADSAALAHLVDDYESVFNAEDAYKYSMLYTEDAVRMPPDEPATIGRDSIAIIAKDAWINVALKVDLHTDEILIAGDWAFVRGSVDATKTFKVGGKSSDVVYKFLWVTSRQQDGTWKIARQMWNTD